jgi:hypothetical protein
MTLQQIHDEVARRTGEDIREIRRHGWSIADPLETGFDPEPDASLLPQLVDWDALERDRYLAICG